MSRFPLFQLLQIRELRLQSAEAVVREKQAALAELEAKQARLEQKIANVAEERALAQAQQVARDHSEAVQTLTRIEQRIQLLQDQLLQLAGRREELLQDVAAAGEAVREALTEYHRIESKRQALQTQHESWQRRQHIKTRVREEQTAEELALTRRRCGL